MFKLNDMIRAYPDVKASEAAVDGQNAMLARVCYIHPYGRFYELEFKFPKGSFRETRWFTAGERELGVIQGIFKTERKRMRNSDRAYIYNQFGDDPFGEMATNQKIELDAAMF